MEEPKNRYLPHGKPVKGSQNVPAAWAIFCKPYALPIVGSFLIAASFCAVVPLSILGVILNFLYQLRGAVRFAILKNQKSY